LNETGATAIQIDPHQLSHRRVIHHLSRKQQKEIALFNSALARIERQPSLSKELSRLVKQKEEMEQRVM